MLKYKFLIQKTFDEESKKTESANTQFMEFMKKGRYNI